MRGKWLLIVSVVVLAAVALGALAWQRHRAASPAPAARVAPLAPARAVVPGEVTLSGKIRAQHVVGIGSLVDGNLEVFYADVGQEVEEGQLLARVSNQGLETGREVAQISAENAQTRVTKIEAQLSAARLEASRIQADLNRAKFDFDRAEKAYQRQRMLHSQGATPRLVFEKSERDYEAAQTDFNTVQVGSKQAEERIQALMDEVQNARKILDDKHKLLEDATGALTGAEIHSPVSGVVVGRRGEVGKPARDQGPEIFQIAADTLALEVVLEPDPPTQARLKVGQPAQVFVSEFSSEGVPGKVKEIKDTLVTVEFVSPNPAIKPGMIAEARIKVE